MNHMFELYLGDAFVLHSATYLVQATVLVVIGLSVGRCFLWCAAARYQILFFTWLSVLALPFVSLACQCSGIGAPFDLRVAMSRFLSSDTDHAIWPVDEQASSLPQLSPEGYRILASALCLIWIAGLLAFLVRVMCSIHKLARLLRRSIAASKEGRLWAVCSSMTNEFCISEIPEIRVSSECNSPAVVGLFKPTILFPSRLVAHLTDEQLRHIVVHEMAHVSRRDHAMVLLQSVVSALFWIHPLIHVLNRHLARVREELCDNYVLNTTEHSAYGHTLLGVAESINGVQCVPLSMGLYTDTWSLEDRVSHILNRRRNTMTKVSLRLISATALGAFAITAAFALSHPAWGDEGAPQEVKTLERQLLNKELTKAETRQAEGRNLTPESRKLERQLLSVELAAMENRLVE